MKKLTNWTIGIVLFVPGFFMLLELMNIFKIRDYIDFSFLIKHYWAIIFLLFPGIYLHFSYMAGDTNRFSLIILGGTLSFIGLISQISFSMGIWGKLWPAFILAPAVGLMECFYLCKRDRNILISVIIITGLSSVLFTKTITNIYYGDYILAMVLISLGLVFLFYKNPKKSLIERMNMDDSKHGTFGSSGLMKKSTIGIKKENHPFNKKGATG